MKKAGFRRCQQQPSTFDSILAVFWYVMVTITATGYGDMMPTTLQAN